MLHLTNDFFLRYIFPKFQVSFDSMLVFVHQYHSQLHHQPDFKQVSRRKVGNDEAVQPREVHELVRQARHSLQPHEPIKQHFPE
jgi:hypothetical protein